ncbi:MAG: T9SS type A sorting domain-containing protein [Bacteroidota bacterium]
MNKPRSYFTLLLLLSTFNYGYSQNQYRFVDATNKWYEFGEWGGNFPGDAIQRRHIVYYFDNDTLINNVVYKKLYNRLYDTIYWVPPFIQDSHGYSAAFRQDSANIYFVLKDSVTESIYYNHNMAIGDTLKYYYSPALFPETVVSIDSVPFGSVGYRKKYNLSYSHTFYEGIGNLFGLFHDFSLMTHGGWYLFCFKQNNISYQLQSFPSSQIPDCNSSIVNNILATEKGYNIEIFPNPTNGIFTIANSQNMGSINYTIFSINGKVIQQKNKALTKNVEVDITSESPGIYFLKIENDYRVKTVKLIKQ